MSSELARAIGQIPCGLFVLTAAYDGAQSGVLAKWVQQCSAKPPMLMVALANDLPIATLIRDSRNFALSQISADDRFLQRSSRPPPIRARIRS
ncbi:MAG: flavin reductase [Planctomycetes bacterium]|nr:flavin reductase [Planctomycetota bacterium]